MKNKFNQLINFIFLAVFIFVISSCNTYRFTLAWSWDRAASSPLALDQLPTDIHFQYIEKLLETVPLTQLYDWEGGIGYENSIRLNLSDGDIPEALQLNHRMV